MSTASELDPFSLVYNKLWDMVERNQRLQAHLVKGNLIKFDEENALKDEIAHADVPELALFMEGGSPGKTTSSSFGIVKNYTWVIATGEYKHALYNLLSFELFRCISDYPCVVCPLAWCGCNFIQHIRLAGVEEGTSMEEINRGIEGWAGLWKIEVEMEFPLSLLKITTPAFS